MPVRSARTCSTPWARGTSSGATRAPGPRAASRSKSSSRHGKSGWACETARVDAAHREDSRMTPKTMLKMPVERRRGAVTQETGSWGYLLIDAPPDKVLDVLLESKVIGAA